MNPKNKLHKFFSKHFPFNKDGLAEFIDLFDIELIKKETILLQAGAVEQKLRFIDTGFVREYYTTAAKEININFYGEHEFIADINSFFGNATTKKNQQAITNLRTFTISKDKLTKMLQQYNCATSLIHEAFKRKLNKKEDLDYKHKTKTPEELYQTLQLKKPEWLKHIPQYHIASYLNITPETLSRIRKRIY